MSKTKFTSQELEIIKRLGLSNSEIAASIGLTEQAVKSSIFKMCNKIRVNNRTAVALYAIENKIVKKVEYNYAKY